MHERYILGGVDIRRHTGVGGTLALTEASVTSVPAGEVKLTSTGSGVHGDGLADDEAIGDELSHSLAGVGVADLADFVGIEPDLVLAAADDRRGQALLGEKVGPIVRKEVPTLASFSVLFHVPPR